MRRAGLIIETGFCCSEENDENGTIKEQTAQGEHAQCSEALGRMEGDVSRWSALESSSSYSPREGVLDE